MKFSSAISRFFSRSRNFSPRAIFIRQNHLASSNLDSQHGLSSTLRNYLLTHKQFFLEEYTELSKQISAGQTSDIKKYLDQWSKLKAFLDLNERLETLSMLDKESIQLLEELDDEADSDLQRMALQETEARITEGRKLENQIMELLLPPEEYSKCQAANVEIIAGAGGLEAAMFARNLFDMYAAFARQHGWEFCPENGSSETDHDPIHHTNILITSPDTADSAYNRLRWEAGVHRVQRVPVTSKLNKIHTSTVAVTILPSLDDTEIGLNAEDLEWEVFRASGAGGQHVNKTESAVRVRHTPTGHVAACQTDRSQHANREAALKALKAKIARDVVTRQLAVEAAERKSQMGSMERSDRIRTYNFQQDRITDHRLARSWNNLAVVLRQGSPFIEEVAREMEETYRIKQLLSLKRPYFLM